MRSHRQDPKTGSVVGSWDIRERTTDVASGTTQELKNPGIRAAKFSISKSLSSAESVHTRALVTTAESAP